VDNPMVDDALKLYKMIEVEKKQGDLKIDSAFIMVGKADKEEIVGAFFFEFPNHGSTPAVMFSKQMAVAASIFLAVGLLSGFGLARLNADKRIAVPTTAKVPMKVARLEGTALVKHQDSELWYPLMPGSGIYLGDTFHSAANSAFVLELEDKSMIELNQNSMLVLKLYNGGTQFHLEHGKLAAALESPHSPFFVSTPHGRVEALGTEFTVTVE